MIFEQGEVSVHWLMGAVGVCVGSDMLLLDAPPGVEQELSRRQLMGSVRAVGLSSGRVGSVGGLIPLLCALEPHRVTDAQLDLAMPIGDDRPAAIAEAWMKGWPDRFPLVIDCIRPGVGLDLGAFSVETMAVGRGQPQWCPNPDIRSIVGLAWRIRVLNTTIAWVPGAPASPIVQNACAGADLAILEIGVTPWPRTERRWRMTTVEALSRSADAAEVWLVGDDGRTAGTCGEN